MLDAMLLTRRLRRWIASGLTLALLFMQMATAAYACPQRAQAGQASAMAEVTADVTADMRAESVASGMPGCEGMAGPMNQMDDELPQLCKAHCVKDAQGRAPSAVPDLQPNPAALNLLVGLVAPPTLLLPPTLRCGHTDAQLRPPGGPPLYLSLLILRN